MAQRDIWDEFPGVPTARKYRAWRHERGPILGRRVTVNEHIRPMVDAGLLDWETLNPTTALRTGEPGALPPPRKVWSPYDPEGLHHVEVGTVMKTGAPWTIPVWSYCTLIAGESGAGKSNLSWTLLCALTPYIESGLVKVYAIDPKGGMESRMGPGFFEAMADDPDHWVKEAIELVGEVRARMSSRIRKLRGSTQTHVPSVAEPLVMIWFDELASISEMGTPTKQEPLAIPLGKIMRQGRALGFSVIGAVQDPRGETMPISLRNLFQRGIGLRMVTRSHVKMVLGDDAWEAGARCEEIHEDEPGVAYDWSAGRATKVRSHLTSADTIRRCAERCAAVNDRGE